MTNPVGVREIDFCQPTSNEPLAESRGVLNGRCLKCLNKEDRAHGCHHLAMIAACAAIQASSAYISVIAYNHNQMGNPIALLYETLGVLSLVPTVMGVWNLVKMCCKSIPK